MFISGCYGVFCEDEFFEEEEDDIWLYLLAIRLGWLVTKTSGINL